MEAFERKEMSRVLPQPSSLVSFQMLCVVSSLVTCNYPVNRLAARLPSSQLSDKDQADSGFHLPFSIRKPYRAAESVKFILEIW
jgi:hypothetical protein